LKKILKKEVQAKEEKIRNIETSNFYEDGQM